MDSDLLQDKHALFANLAESLATHNRIPDRHTRHVYDAYCTVETEQWKEYVNYAEEHYPQMELNQYVRRGQDYYDTVLGENPHTT